MKRYLFPLIFFLPLTSASQDTTRWKQTRVEKKYPSGNIVLIIEGHKTTDRAFGLFKPDQITMRDERPHHQRGDTLVLTIRVKDKNHPTLAYFDNRAKLLYKNQLYPFGEIPDINPAQVSNLAYHAFNGVQDDFLEVVLFGEEHIPSKSMKFQSEVETIRDSFMDLDGKLYTAEEFRKISFRRGELVFRGSVRGKDAVEKYGDKKYAVGVMQYTRKK
jgi:hypothetical protein